SRAPVGLTVVDVQWGIALSAPVQGATKHHGAADGGKEARRALRPVGAAVPTQTSAGHSIVRVARPRSVDWTAPAVSPAFSASSPCPASLVTVILANSVSQETGSDLVSVR